MADASSRGGLWSSLALAAVALAIVIARETGGDVAVFLEQRVSLRSLSLGVDDHVLQLLMVPLAALVVVFCRLTLGIRMLGPFRPILIAVAIQEIGVMLGTACIVVVLTVVVAIRPRLRGGWLPYFGRLSVLLSVVAVALVVAVMIGANLEYEPLEKLAYFPIVVLCLTADGFARSLSREGVTSASARAAATVGTAVLINLVVEFEWVQNVLFEHPELIFAEVALIVLVSTRLRFGLLEWLNPRRQSRDEG